MARPPADLPPAAALQARIDATGHLVVRVTPGARQPGISVEGARVLVKVRAKPQDGAATAAVLALVAEALGIAPGRVTLLRGATARDKLLAIDR